MFSRYADVQEISLIIKTWSEGEKILSIKKTNDVWCFYSCCHQKNKIFRGRWKMSEWNRTRPEVQSKWASNSENAAEITQVNITSLSFLNYPSLTKKQLEAKHHKGQVLCMHVEPRKKTSTSAINFITEVYGYPGWKTNSLYQWKWFCFYFYQSRDMLITLSQGNRCLHIMGLAL